MKPRKMRSRVMWAVVTRRGKPLAILETPKIARYEAEGYYDARVVRVRVTEEP